MRFLFLLALAAGLAGCGTPAPRPDTVRETINNELAQAAGNRKSAEAAEKALLAPLTIELPKQENVEPRFDLAVVSAPATQVFMAIVTGTRYNMLVGPEVAGNITVNLKDVTVKEALEAIRELYGYEFSIKGNRIAIQPNTLQTRMFYVNYLAVARKGDSTLAVGGNAQMSSSSSGGGAPAQQQAPAGGGMPAAAGNTGGQTSGDPSGSNVKTDNSIDFWETLKTTLEAIVGGGGAGTTGTTGTPSGGAAAGGEGKVTINKVSGIVVVRAAPRELRLVEDYLKSSRLVVERQVMLEAKILEVTLSEQYQAGVNWSSFNRTNSRLSLGVLAPGSTLVAAGGTGAGGTDALLSSAVTAMPGAGGSMAAAAASALGGGFVGLAFQTANFAALINFLESQGKVSVLSSPRIATLNNQKAVLKVGTDEIYATGFTMTTVSGVINGQTTTSNVPVPITARLFSGISLDATPQIDEDGNIVLHVHPAISTIREVEKVFQLGTGMGGPVSLPLASRDVNETDSIVRVQDGNIVAIGGLMTQRQSSESSGLPGTLNSPAGTLVGQRGGVMTKRELVILLKPTIIHDDRAWVKDLRQSGERLRAFDLPPLSVSLD